MRRTLFSITDMYAQQWQMLKICRKWIGIQAQEYYF